MTARTVGLPALALAGTLLAAPLSAQGAEVVGLRFDGAESFTRAELAAAIETRATRCRNVLFEVVCWLGVAQEPAYLLPGGLEADAFRLKIYYYERGFREAEITPDTTRVDDGLVVTFSIQEGRPVRVARVELTGAPSTLSTRGLPVSTGVPFDVVSYEATRDTLIGRLRDDGYGEAQVLLGYGIDREDPYAATVQYEVVPGRRLRFGDIRIEGNDAVTPELVRRMLTFEEGDRYSASNVLRSQRNLYGLQIFRHAIIEPDMAGIRSDTLVPVQIRLAEGTMRRVRAGAGINNVECGTVEGRWTSRNFMGNGRRMTLTGRLGNLLVDSCDPLVDDASATYRNLTGLFSIDFTQPWFFGPRNSVGMGLFVERRNVPEVFVRSAAGGYISIGRSLGSGTGLTLAYRPELTELATHQGGDLFFCVNFVGCTFQDVAVLQDPHFLSPVTLSFAMDRTDSPFTPSSGVIVRADLEHAGSYTLSDFAYSRVLAEASAYLGEQGGVILATRLRAGVGWAHDGGAGSQTLGLNPQKRFFAGGPNSVRGFDQYRLGPTVLGIDAVPYLVEVDDDPETDRVEGLVGCSAESVNDFTCDVTDLARSQPNLFEQRPAGGEVLLEGNVELRFPLPLGGGKLRGAAFVDAGQVWRTRGDFSLRDLVATPGVGLRYHSPIGPIRVDAAFDPRGPQQLQVLTTRVTSCQMDQVGCGKFGDQPKAALRNTDTVAPLMQTVPFGSDLGEIDSLGDVFRRFNLQFSIGQAF